MSSIKNPDHEAENPAPMPEGHRTNMPEGHKAKMAPRSDAPPGLEQDSHGDVIPLEKRTRDDQERAAGKKPDAE